uniref:Uncharacterized protein LOC105643603 isoform X1 n=1 Tax=Rhizophora mucronata TaxID=61149 RepID=A0A2P2MBS6_RHIMU
MEIKRKSPLQLQALENFYAEQKYPSHKAMEDLAVILDLTFRQVHGWFIEKRRRDKIKSIPVVSPRLTKKLAAKKTIKRKDTAVFGKAASHITSTSMNNASLQFKGRGQKRKKKLILQDLLNPDYILMKIFRKDGPPLGVKFDTIPFRGSRRCEDSINALPSDQENQRTYKRRNVLEEHNETTPVKKHGIGKGLMTVWRAVNPNGGDFPTGVCFAGRKAIDVPQISTPVPRKPPRQSKRRQKTISIMTKLANKAKDARKSSVKRTEVPKKHTIQKRAHREKCELALEGALSLDHLNWDTMLADDEDIELRELQAGPNPLICSDDCATNGLHGCSLCKDLLPKFPPNAVKMKQPFTMQPWGSSLDAVKKLFKVFHFLYTYSVMIHLCPFTLDEFAQAFHDKDSLLLGKIHVALLRLLFSNIESEMSSGNPPHSSMSCNFLALLHSIEDQESVVEFWKRSLNPLTWTEILRQVLVAAGYGSKQGALRKEAPSKEMRLMVKYGLRQRTLKGELFRLLSEQGNNGLKVSNLANSSQIAELNLASTSQELELLISSTLSSDITLFEKISSSVYRLRVNTVARETSDFQSDTEDSGSVHNDFSDSSRSSGSDSECDSESSNSRKDKHIIYKSQKSALTVHNEIDESHSGEVWLLGLMEGEYSGLSIEERLNALVALIDILSGGSSIRKEDPMRPAAESAPHMCRRGSGAKIKRSLSNRLCSPQPSWPHVGLMGDAHKMCTASGFCRVDSSVPILNAKDNLSCKEKDINETGPGLYLHPMQSIFLGSDRRYNRYWLFLGPCDAFDPGHKRIYFESSEDGHWKVIDTEEALHALLSVLDGRGKREAFLFESLEKRKAFLSQEMSSRIVKDAERNSARLEQSELEIVREDSCSPVSDVDNNLSLSETTEGFLPTSGAIALEVGNNGELGNQKWSRLQEFDAWIWNYFYCDLNAVKHSKRSYFESLTRCETCHDLFWRDEKHCRICHTTFELDFDLEERYAIHSATCRVKIDNEILKHKVLSSQLQSLKAAVHAIEVCCHSTYLQFSCSTLTGIETLFCMWLVLAVCMSWYECSIYK